MAWGPSTPPERHLDVPGPLKAWRAMLELAQRGLADDGTAEDQEQATALIQDAMPVIHNISTTLQKAADADPKTRLN